VEIGVDALHRGELLDQLSAVKTAFCDTDGAASECQMGTHEVLLDDIDAWYNNQDPDCPPVYWMTGIAGTGKTTIAHSVCKRHKDYVGATFFFSRENADRRLSLIIPTLAYQLAYLHPALGRAICEVLFVDPDSATRAIQSKADNLFTEALQK
jgi:hypothetical protein